MKIRDRVQSAARPRASSCRRRRSRRPPRWGRRRRRCPGLRGPTREAAERQRRGQRELLIPPAATVAGHVHGRLAARQHTERPPGVASPIGGSRLDVRLGRRARLADDRRPAGSAPHSPVRGRRRRLPPRRARADPTTRVVTRRSSSADFGVSATPPGRALDQVRDDGRRKRRSAAEPVEHVERVDKRGRIRHRRARPDHARVVADHVGEQPGMQAPATGLRKPAALDRRQVLAHAIERGDVGALRPAAAG